MTTLFRLLFGSLQLQLSMLLLIAVLAIASCAKTGEVVIKNNEAPPDRTVNDVVIGNYVNRVYISVLGREPNNTERTNGFNILRQNDVSALSRFQFLDSVFTKTEYYDHLYDLARIDLLNNVDTADITFYINVIFTPLLSDPNYALQWDDIKKVIANLDSLEAIPADLRSHTIDVTGLNRRCVNNFFYDQINMGTENFVISVFQHFLNRYPTLNELSNSKQMVNGFAGNLFFSFGQTKDDFLTVFFSSNDYYEGTIRMLYKRYLFRDPTSVEMNDATQSYRQSKDYIKAQKEILAKNEYIGI